jgi:predicted Zn-dependent protease
MTYRLRSTLAGLTIAFSLLSSGMTLAQEGVDVRPGGSAVGRLIPAEAIEQQAVQEYGQLKQEAASKGLLAGSKDPQLIRLRKISNRILPHTAKWNARAGEWPWEVNLIKSKEINAFCMPGGKIAFFTGILDQLKLTDDEVAMVMGHEIAHALQEHARARAAKSELTSAGASLLSQIFGLGDLGNMALGVGAQLMTLKFSRGDESEADLVGLDIAARAGYDPRASITLWQKMGAAGGGAPIEFLSTHPSGTSRIAELEKQIPNVLPLYARAKGTTIAKLPPYRTNVSNLGAAPQDAGDQNRNQPLPR